MGMQKFKYGNCKIIIKYCAYEKFNWYTIKYKGIITIYINSKFTEKCKSEILHKVIKYYGGNL